MTDAVLDEILEEIASDVHCRDGCGWKIVARQEWCRTPLDQREEMRRDGYRRGSTATQLCEPCHLKRHRRENPAKSSHDTKPGERAATYLALREQGRTKSEARLVMGVSRGALNASIDRAIRRGDLDERWRL